MKRLQYIERVDLSLTFLLRAATWSAIGKADDFSLAGRDETGY
nr:hypothetical protein [Cupriavidus necator]